MSSSSPKVPGADSDSDSPGGCAHSGLRPGDVQECETDSQLQQPMWNQDTNAEDAPIAAQPYASDTCMKSAPLDEADSDFELCARFGNSKVHPPHEWMETSDNRRALVAKNRHAIFWSRFVPHLIWFPIHMTMNPVRLLIIPRV